MLANRTSIFRCLGVFATDVIDQCLVLTLTEKLLNNKLIRRLSSDRGLPPTIYWENTQVIFTSWKLEYPSVIILFEIYVFNQRAWVLRKRIHSAKLSYMDFLRLLKKCFSINRLVMIQYCLFVSNYTQFIFSVTAHESNNTVSCRSVFTKKCKKKKKKSLFPWIFGVCLSLWCYLVF